MRCLRCCERITHALPCSRSVACRPDQLFTAVRATSVSILRLMVARFWHIAHVELFTQLLDAVNAPTLKNTHGLTCETVRIALLDERVGWAAKVALAGQPLIQFITDNFNKKVQAHMAEKDDRQIGALVVFYFNRASGRIVVGAASPSTSSPAHGGGASAHSSPAAISAPSSAAQSPSGRMIATWNAEPTTPTTTPKRGSGSSASRPPRSKKAAFARANGRIMAASLQRDSNDAGSVSASNASTSSSVASDVLSAQARAQLRKNASAQQLRYESTRAMLPGGVRHKLDADVLSAVSLACVDQQRYIGELHAAAERYGAGYGFGIGAELDATHPVGSALGADMRLVSAPADGRHDSSVLQAFVQQAKVWRDSDSYPDTFRDYLRAHPGLVPMMSSARALRQHLGQFLTDEAANRTTGTPAERATNVRVATSIKSAAVWTDAQLQRLVLPSLARMFHVDIHCINSSQQGRDTDRHFRAPVASSDASEASAASPASAAAPSAPPVFTLIEVPSQWYGTLKETVEAIQID